MKITAIETYIAGNPWKNWLFTRVLTDSGIYGIGEGTMNFFARTIETCIHELKPFVLGLDPFQIEVVVQRLTRDVWGREVDKMIRWGARVTPEERSPLIEFLATRWGVR